MIKGWILYMIITGNGIPAIDHQIFDTKAQCEDHLKSWRDAVYLVASNSKQSYCKEI